MPLIQDRADGRYDLTRLVVEKAASINTTATGGNASLMSLAGEVGLCWQTGFGTILCFVQILTYTDRIDSAEEGNCDVYVPALLGCIT